MTVDWASVLAPATVLAGAGDRPRPLKEPAAILLDVDGDGPVTVGSRAVLRWVLHPALESWLRERGARDAAHGLALTAKTVNVAELVLSQAPKRPKGRPAVALTARTVSLVKAPVLRDLDPWDAIELAKSHRGVTVLGTPRWFELARSSRHAFLVRSCPGHPARVRAGVPGQLAVMEATAALELASRSHGDSWIHVDDVALDLADMALSGPANRNGLTDAQDAAVSALLATEVGALLAMPPGSGKTVVTACALAESPQRRSIVLAPSATLAQWSYELSVWAPERDVRVCTSARQLPDRVGAGQVVVTSLDLGAAWLSGGIETDDLVVDEAVALLAKTKRAASLRAARTCAKRAWALTGTPSERAGDKDVRELVSWARAAEVDESLTASDMTPVLLTGQQDGHVPPVDVERIAVPAAEWDLQWLDALAGQMSAATAFEAARQADIARRGLGDRLALGDHGRSSKRDAAVRVLADHANEHGSALACTDSLPVGLAVVEALERCGVRAAMLASGMSRMERTRLLAEFSAGNLRVLVVTPASQRGVNLQAASLVVHLDLPATLAQFHQRNARAARMGSAHDRVRAVVLHLAGTWDERWAEAFLAGGLSPLDSR